ncbi:MAG: thioredoxin [Clostridia bacterium]|nr:thioredoxin [Deltaproteobacteria bacterium]
MGFFETAVIEPSQITPVLVDFWAPWCGPCRVLTPVLEKVTSAFSGRVTLVKINTEEHQDIAARFRIQSIPAVKLFDQGNAIGEFVGALPEREVVVFLNRLLPTDESRALAAAKDALRTGDRATALTALKGKIHQDSKSSEARALYAGLSYFEHRDHALALAATVREGDVGFDLADAVLTLDRLASAELPVEAKAAAEFARGSLAFRKASFGEAASEWLSSMKISRKLLDDGARRALIALFTLLGEEDPVTLEYRRAFASALY